MSLTIIPGRNGGTQGLDESFSTGGRVQAAIANAASSTGVDFNYLYHQAKVESGLNPNAQASTSSASGLYQFTNQTWLSMVKQHGAEHGLNWAASAITKGADGRYSVSDPTTKQEILALRQNPEVSAAMAGEYASDNQDYLSSKLGRTANSVDLYLAHFLGAAGASRFLKAKDADSSQSAAAIMPAAARANRWVFYNKDGSSRSLDDVYQRFAQHFQQSEGGSTASRLASSGATTGGTAAAQAIRAVHGATDTSAELARMQLAALNGAGSDDDMTQITAAADDAGLTAKAIESRALMTPSPQTARLAYLMLAGLGV